jgi:ArsR family transcriptional regulator, cadmium/lead-responsive transcriptional repressor
MEALATDLRTKAKLFRGFSDPSRLTILEALVGGSKNVSELIQITGLTQSNLSNHLACLRDCELVKAEQQGRFVYYHLSDSRITLLLQLSNEILDEVAHGVAACCNYEEGDCK